MIRAFLFPGQGSQYPGMGADLVEAYPHTRDVFEQADHILGFSLSEIMFDESDGAADRLRQTEITQPALFVHSVAAAAVLDKLGVKAQMAAGHSLGEYSALVAAGAISFEDGLRVVRRRGELMAQAGDARPGTMAAVLGLDDDVIKTICAEVAPEHGTVQAANFNAPGQVVISGDPAAVEIASQALTESGARRVVPLPVSGAFHSELMEYAVPGLREALDGVEIQAPTCPVYLNVTARPAQDPEEIRRRLLEQLTAPVLWTGILSAMSDDGATRFVEVGAGAVLSGLVKRTLGRSIETKPAGKAEDFERPEVFQISD